MDACQALGAAPRSARGTGLQCERQTNLMLVRAALDRIEVLRTSNCELRSVTVFGCMNERKSVPVRDDGKEGDGEVVRPMLIERTEL